MPLWLIETEAEAVLGVDAIAAEHPTVTLEQSLGGADIERTGLAEVIGVARLVGHEDDVVQRLCIRVHRGDELVDDVLAVGIQAANA